MKTTEEKAKAYDEVVNKLRHFIAKGVDPLITRADVQDFFPELAESEDEKIRREIINYFKCQTRDEPSRKDIHNKWISWLERQEGCEVIKKDWLEYIKQSWYKEGFIDGKYAEKRCLEWTQNDATILNELIDFLKNKTVKLQHDLALYASWLKRKFYPFEKQGEQKPQRMISAEAKEAMYDKPADTVEPKFKVGDKIYLKPEYRMPDDDTPIANTIKEIRRIDDKHYRFDGSYIFIEDQDKYELVEQKPEENKGNIVGISSNWSVEDEENFCSVYLDVKSARQNTVNSLSGELKEQEQKRMDEVISWLRSLKGRVLPKQEWSEEDEQHIDSLLKRLDALCRNKFERTRFAISEDRDWLKSLRPQNTWKPSDEQIECLSDAIEHYNSLGYPAPKLKELLDDLKELKGEV